MNPQPDPPAEEPDRPRDPLPPLGDPKDDLERARYLLDDVGTSPGERNGSEGTRGTEIDTLYEVACAVNTTLDIEELLPRVLDLAILHSGAERGILFYFDPKTGETYPWVVRGMDEKGIEEAHAYSRSIIDQIRNRQTVHSSDVPADPHFSGIASLSLQQIRSLISVPIIYGEQVLGAIYLDSRDSGRRLDGNAVHFAGVLAGLSAIAIKNAERFSDLIKSHARLARQLSRYEAYDEIIGRSRPMMDVLHQLERVATTAFPVLLVGENGSGKELVARALHRAGSRRSGPFITQNCAAIPSELLESEFFGHARGAFTGAHVARDGLFHLAEGGTLFLDEVGDLDLRLQAKLLRVLEDGKVRPIGSPQERLVDFRLVSATSRNLSEEVAAGHFRQDLYYRLNVVIIRIPPLRERATDIPLLFQHFVAKHRGKAGGRDLRLSTAAMKILQRRAWKGNVRELEHFVKRALVLVERPVVEASDLPPLLENEMPEIEHTNLPVGDMTLREIEEWSIREALRRSGGNKARAASILGIHRNALLRRLEKMTQADDGSTPAATSD